MLLSWLYPSYSRPNKLRVFIRDGCPCACPQTNLCSRDCLFIPPRNRVSPFLLRQLPPPSSGSHPNAFALCTFAPFCVLFGLQDRIKDHAKPASATSKSSSEKLNGTNNQVMQHLVYAACRSSTCSLRKPHKHSTPVSSLTDVASTGASFMRGLPSHEHTSFHICACM